LKKKKKKKPRKQSKEEANGRLKVNILSSSSAASPPLSPSGSGLSACESRTGDLHSMQMKKEAAHPKKRRQLSQVIEGLDVAGMTSETVNKWEESNQGGWGLGTLGASGRKQRDTILNKKNASASESDSESERKKSKKKKQQLKKERKERSKNKKPEEREKKSTLHLISRKWGHSRSNSESSDLDKGRLSPVRKVRVRLP